MYKILCCDVCCSLPLIMLTLTCLTELPMSEEQPTSSQAGASGSGELPDILSIENIDVDLLPEHAEGQCLFYRRIPHRGVLIYFYYFCNHAVDSMHAKMCTFMWAPVLLSLEYICQMIKVL